MASLLAAIWVLERRKDSASWGQGGESPVFSTILGMRFPPLNHKVAA